MSAEALNNSSEFSAGTLIPDDAPEAVLEYIYNSGGVLEPGVGGSYVYFQEPRALADTIAARQRFTKVSEVPGSQEL